MRFNYLKISILVSSIALSTTTVEATPFLPYYGAATFTPGAVIDNPYFPMTTTVTRVYEGEFEEDGEIVTERFELTNSGPGPVLLGVQTWTQTDRAFESGLLVEETHDYFAQDDSGNVWYFGEDVTNFVYDDDDNLIGTNSDSAWLAGANGALPGLIMPADPIVGFNYFQEWAAADEALDHGTIHALDTTVSIGIGTFSNIIQVLESSTLEPDFLEFKYYAPGIGLILVEEDLDELLMNPELRVELVTPVPVPAAFPLLVSAVGGLGLLGRRRRS